MSDLRDSILTWLEINKPAQFCCLDVWVDVLGGDRSSYTERAARQIKIAVKAIDGCEAGAKRIFPRWGQQRYFRYAHRFEDLGV